MLLIRKDLCKVKGGVRAAAGPPKSESTRVLLRHAPFLVGPLEPAALLHRLAASESGATQAHFPHQQKLSVFIRGDKPCKASLPVVPNMSAED